MLHVMQDQDPAIKELDLYKQAIKRLQERDDGLSIADKADLAIIFSDVPSTVKIYLSLEDAEIRAVFANKIIERHRQRS